VVRLDPLELERDEDLAARGTHVRNIMTVYEFLLLPKMESPKERFRIED
jgi:hypothetical protein